MFCLDDLCIVEIGILKSVTIVLLFLPLMWEANPFSLLKEVESSLLIGGLWWECVSGFLTISVWVMWAFLIHTVCESCSFSFWISCRGSCSECSCRFSVSMGGGEFRSFLYYHLGLKLPICFLLREKQL